MVEFLYDHQPIDSYEHSFLKYIYCLVRTLVQLYALYLNPGYQQWLKYIKKKPEMKTPSEKISKARLRHFINDGRIHI